MDVISDRDVVNETPKPGLSPSDQSHEQRPAWVAPGLPTMVGALVAMAAGIGLAAAAGKNGGLIAFATPDPRAGT